MQLRVVLDKDVAGADQGPEVVCVGPDGLSPVVVDIILHVHVVGVDIRSVRVTAPVIGGEGDQPEPVPGSYAVGDQGPVRRHRARVRDIGFDALDPLTRNHEDGRQSVEGVGGGGRLGAGRQTSREWVSVSWKSEGGVSGTKVLVVYGVLSGVPAARPYAISGPVKCKNCAVRFPPLRSFVPLGVVEVVVVVRDPIPFS